MLYGADVARLRRLAQSFSNEARTLEAVPGVIDSLIETTSWSGPDHDIFRDLWGGQLRPALVAAIESLEHAASVAEANADAQEEASTPADTVAETVAAVGGLAAVALGIPAVAHGGARQTPVPAGPPADPDAADYLGPEMQALRDSIPRDAGSAEVRQWWNSLSAAEKRVLLNAWPVDLYQLDGIPRSVKKNLEGDGPYNRMDAVGYAIGHWDDKSVDIFPRSMGNCANYVSHVLEAGGMKHTTQWGYKGEEPRYDENGFPKHTNVKNAWSNANDQHNMWVKSGHDPINPRKAVPGDLVYFDFEGDGKFDHAMIVRAVGPDGKLYLAGHTYNTRTKVISPSDKDYEVFHPESTPDPAPSPSPGPSPTPPSSS